MDDIPDDGGPAFPVSSNVAIADEGMRLRDWFAGRALTGLLAGSPDSDCGPIGYAKDAYGMADAMLAVRRSTK